MSTVGSTIRSARDGLAERLLPLALSRPSEAFAEATRLLDGRPDPATASVARQVRAIVLRDSDRPVEAVAELRRALRLAERSGSALRLADVGATLGLTLGLAGRVTEGLTLLDRAVAAGTGVDTGRALTRRGYLLRVLGRYPEALADLRRAVRLLGHAGDTVWEARARSHRFLVYAALGEAARADRDLAVAQRLHAAAGQDLESAMAVHNRAELAFQAGDLPAALGFLDAAEARYAALGTSWPTLAIDRCAVLLAAGLAGEAVTATEAALRRHTAGGGNGTSVAELLFAAAQAAQAAGQPALAAERAAAARELFRRQGRRWWQVRASFVAVQSRYAAGERGGRLAAAAGRLADELDAVRAPEAPAAHLLAGRLAADRRMPDADRHLARAARFRHRGPVFGHATGWLAAALRADARGATAAALVACRRGLQAAAEHQRALAAPELRAYAAAYGAELAALAQRHAVRRADARMLLRWSERWRASALAMPAVRPPDDRELAAELAALRNVAGRLAAARAAGRPTDRLDAERRRLESAIRARTRRITGGLSGPDSPARADDDPVTALLDGLGGHRLVELTVVDGQLYAVTAIGRRVRMTAVGPVDVAVRELELARFQLRRLAHGRPPAGALAALDAAGRRLQEALLGPAAAGLGEAPVVVVPPARLHAVPWGLLPALRATPVVVAPSAAAWLRAGRLPAPHRRRVALVIGPGLGGGADEVRRIGTRYRGAVVLADGAATAEATLAALDGAGTAHIAAHGTFRADNPLFSAVSLDDGPLTVYDLGRLRRAPRRLVLSSCDSGVAVPVGADELLGVVTALLPLGTASLLASVVPVNDAATAPLMVQFHDRLRAGSSFGAALRAVRGSVTDDPVAAATALSFVALGR